MIGKLKPMQEIIEDVSCKIVVKNNHYWKFYYEDKDTLGFRDFYLKYWKGDRFVHIKPKRDRKKNIIPGKWEVYGKRGNYVFTVYEHWLDRSASISGYEATMLFIDDVNPIKGYTKIWGQKRVKPQPCNDLPWDQLFEV